MRLKLAKAERLLIAQIVNIKLDSATLKDHILLEGIYKAVKPFDIKVPTPPEFVPEDKRNLFAKYENKKISDIEDADDKKVLGEAIAKSREKEMELYTSLEKTEGFDFQDEQIKTLKDFFDKDKRTFPREYHEAIVSLYNKLEVA